MNTLKNILVIAATATFLAGCSVTSSPIVFDEFKANTNDSFAKTTMRLGGSNKFVDSKAGQEVTREVTGKNVNRVLKIVSFNLVGLLQDSITDSVIENEPLAEKPYFIIEVGDVAERDLGAEKSLQTISSKAEEKLLSLVKNSGLKVGDRRLLSNGRLIHYPVLNNDEICESFSKASRSACGILIQRIGVASYNKETRKAYVGINVLSVPITTFISSKYTGSDVSLFIPKRIVSYGTKYSKYQVAETPIVIHAGKAHKFVRGSTLNDGVVLNELKFYYGITEKENNDKQTLYTVNPLDMTFTEIPLN